MKYLKIKNQGEIEPQALTLMGASTKAGDESKIGMFGSGNKFGLAYLMRNKIDVKIFTGKKEIPISIKKESFRENSFGIIYINGERTSLTTQMGKDWELWQAIREFYSNALDEGGVDIEIVDTISPEANETHFYIEANKAVTDFMINFDEYFNVNRRAIYSCPDGKVFEKLSSEAIVYRRGIKCSEYSIPSTFDYDLTVVGINESRILNSPGWAPQERIMKMIMACTHEGLIERFIKATSVKGSFECFSGSMISIYKMHANENFINVIGRMKLAPMEYGGMLTEDERETFVLIPNNIYEEIVDFMKEENKAMFFADSVKGNYFSEIKPTELHKATLKKAEEFLTECQYVIGYKVQVVKFANPKILGMAANETIYVSDIAIEKGTQDLVNTLIEENIHLKYGVSDETRAFQTAAIGEMIDIMKKAYAFPL